MVAAARGRLGPRILGAHARHSATESTKGMRVARRSELNSFSRRAFPIWVGADLSINGKSPNSRRTRSRLGHLGRPPRGYGRRALRPPERRPSSERDARLEAVRAAWFGKRLAVFPVGRRATTVCAHSGRLD